MLLEDEIDSFSNRREKSADNTDRYEKDDDEGYDQAEWDDEADSSLDYNFKMYKLSELALLNDEIESNEILQLSFWKALKYYFNKERLNSAGLIVIKIKKLVSSDDFEGVEIANSQEMVEELEKFSKHLYAMHKRRTLSNLVVMAIFCLLEYWTGWSIVWYCMMAWYGVDTLSIQWTYKQRKAWLHSAFAYVNRVEESGATPLREENSKVSEVVEFNRYLTQQEQASWSVRLYDAVANLFKRGG
jgi:hypothetical protein